MTLIVSAITWNGAVQGSDRLVSAGGRPFDAQSNKTVVYVAAGAVAAIAYTGTAFIDGIHTDTWIVEQLIDHRFPRTGNLGIMMGGPNVLPTLGQAVRRLGAAVEGAFARRLVPAAALGVSFEIVLCGWTSKLLRRNKPRPARPFVWVLRRDVATNRVAWIKSPRYLRLAPVPSVGQTRGSQLITHAAPRSHRDVLGPHAFWDRLMAPESPEDFEAALVDSIRDAAAIHPAYIGRDCMVTTMPQPGHKRVIIKYHPDPAASAFYADGAPKIAYSPWVVAPGVLFPPTEQSMGSPGTLMLGDWTVEQTFVGAGEPRVGGVEPHERRKL